MNEDVRPPGAEPLDAVTGGEPPPVFLSRAAGSPDVTVVDADGVATAVEGAPWDPDTVGCPECGAGGQQGVPVYAVGSIEPRFPTRAVERELAQAVSRSESVDLTDFEVLRQVLSERHNRYIARRMCWAFLVEGVETYVLVPRDQIDYELLVEAVRSDPDPNDVDVVIGHRIGVSRPEACNGLVVPIVRFEQLYSFDRASLIASVPKPARIGKERFEATAREVFSRIMQVADNAGGSDAHRALNYLAVRYPGIYHRAVEAHTENAGLSGIEVRPSRLSGARTIMDVIFSFTNRQTDVVDKSFVRVDVTEEFPYLVSKLATYYDRD